MRRAQDQTEIRKPIIVVGLFLGLHVLFVYWQPTSTWGVDFLRFHDTVFRVIFVLLSVALLFFATRRRLGRWTRGFARTIDSQHGAWQSVLSWVLYLVGGLLVFLGPAFGRASAR